LDKGGGVFNFGTVTLINSTLSGNSATSQGGGVFNSSSASLTVINSTISGNSTIFLGVSVPNGEGVANYGTATVINSTISGNNTVRGAGGVIDGAT
jgi:hypothetical protein